MEKKNTRWSLRLDSFSDALKSLETITPRYKELNELEKDGLVQRFEFNVELAWKVMQDYLRSEGYQGLYGPRPVITQMGADGLIDPFAWNDILAARNELRHIYDENKSRQHLDNIVYNYIPVLQRFRDKMTTLLLEGESPTLLWFDVLHYDTIKNDQLKQFIDREGVVIYERKNTRPG